jgi:hypothetical protein
MMAEIDVNFEIWSEKLDSYFLGLKHCVVSLLVTGVSEESVSSNSRVVNEDEASSLLRSYLHHIRNGMTPYPKRP